MTGKKPSHWGIEFASRFKDPSVARAYLLRPPYPPETFQILSGLITDSPKNVLDVGCGTGNIAREIAGLVDRVDAVDFSEPMIETAKALPNGSQSNINWIVGRIEDIPLQSSYSLILGGQSLHWTDWDVVFSRFRKVLSPHGYLAVVDLDSEPLPWKTKLEAIIKKFSTMPNHQRYDMIADWQRHRLFEKQGEKKTESIPFVQSLDDYVTSFHSMSSLTRNAMGADRARTFDREVRRAVKPHLQGTSLELMTFSTIVWGTIVR